MNKNTSSKGFTLVEMAVAVGLLGMISVAAVALFFSTIRGGGKVSVGTEVKQNGQFAVSTMEQLIRNSLALTSCTNSGVVLQARDGASLTFSCTNIGPTGYIASNSARLTSTSVAVTSCGFSCSIDTSGRRPPLISVNFTVRQANVDVEEEGTAEADFSTSVSLRNY